MDAECERLGVGCCLNGTAEAAGFGGYNRRRNGRVDRARHLPHTCSHGEVIGGTIAADRGVVWDGSDSNVRSPLLLGAGGAVPSRRGEYVYLREGYGSRVAFLYGWMSVAVMDPGLAAALAMGATPYVLSLFGVSLQVRLWIPVVILVGLALLNYVGTRLSRRVMAVANLLKIAVLLCLVIWAWISGHATAANLMPLTLRRSGSESILAAIAGATVSAFFSFGGWWDAGKVAGEVRNPRRTLPLAFTLGVLIVTTVYLLVSFAFLSVVPVERIVSNTAFVAQFGEALFGSVGGKVLSACVLLSVFGGLMALTMAAPRVLCDGERWRIFSGLRATPLALRHPGQCSSTADLPGPPRSLLWSLRSNPLLHHLLGNLLPCPLCRVTLPAQRACDALVVSCRSHTVSSGLYPDQSTDPDA